MGAQVREATPDDLDTIAALTRSHRHRLADWSPQWWRAAEAADDLHPLWLGHLITSDLATVRVVVADDQVIATAVAMAQAGRWFIDDIAVADDALWPVVAPTLADGIPERPALTSAATADRARADALVAARIHLVSSYWIRATEPGTAIDGSGRAATLTGAALPEPPPHTFGGGFDPAAPGALALSSGAGTVIGSPSSPAPPVYDPGGPVTVVDRMYGTDLDALATTALAVTAARGDVLLAVVCAADDGDLAATLVAHGFVRTVDVHRWPDGG